MTTLVRPLTLVVVAALCSPDCSRSPPPTSSRTSPAHLAPLAQEDGQSGANGAIDGAPSDDVEASPQSGDPARPPPAIYAGPIVGQHSAPPSGTATTSDDWLRAHGVARWGRDGACWSSITVGGRTTPFLDCECSQSLVLAPPASVDLLVCKRPHDVRDAYAPAVVHTVLYAAEHGTLRVVLDVPTYIAANAEALPVAMPRGVSLDVSASGAEVVLGDRAECADGLVKTDAAVRDAPANERGGLAHLRGLFASICAVAGRWRWTGSSLAPQR